MAMHYSRTKINREITLMDLIKKPEEECWEIVRKCRFGDQETFACPLCKNVNKHYFVSTRKIWNCISCQNQFSLTSGTPLHKRKLSYNKLLCIIFYYLQTLQGSNANFLLPLIGVTYKTAFINLGKIREVVFEIMDFTPLKGTIHIDCLHICGKPRRSNSRKATDSFVVNNKLRSRKDSIVPDRNAHPEPHNMEKLKNRRIVLVLSQLAPKGDGFYGSDKTITYIIKNERAETILPLIKKSVHQDSTIMTDFGNAFNKIEPLLGIKHQAVNHSIHYQDESGVNNNQAEAFFSRIRRAEIGTFNAISKNYLAFYTAEFAFKNDNKTKGIKTRFFDLLSKILSKEPSKAFCGYNQGVRLGFEYRH